MEINIRKATIEDTPGIAEVLTKSWQTTYREIIHAEYLNHLDSSKKAEWLAKVIAQNGIIHIAETDKIIGLASGGKNRSSHIPIDGELYSIYLLKEYQGMGIGKKLLDAVVQQLLSQSIKSMLLWVLKDNPSKPFYISMGGRLIEEKEIEIGGQKLLEEAYVWEDILNIK
jgi:L-amino acid N-acyltransferase YncA